MIMPFCTHCGTFVEDRDRFCPDCGNEVNVRRRATGKLDDEQIVDPEQPVGETFGAPVGSYTISPHAYEAPSTQAAGQAVGREVGQETGQTVLPTQQTEQKPTVPHPNNIVIFGFIMSLLGLLVIPLIPAYICNIYGLIRVKKYGARRRGLAVTGLVFTVFWSFIYFLLFAASSL